MSLWQDWTTAVLQCNKRTRWAFTICSSLFTKFVRSPGKCLLTRSRRPPQRSVSNVAATRSRRHGETGGDGGKVLMIGGVQSIWSWWENYCYHTLITWTATQHVRLRIMKKLLVIVPALLALCSVLLISSFLLSPCIFLFLWLLLSICHRSSSFRCICSAPSLDLLQLSEAFHLGEKLLPDDLSLQMFLYDDFGMDCERSCSL